MTDTNDIKRISEVLDKGRIGILTTQGSSQHLVSRPLAIVDREFDGKVYFFTPDPSPKTDDVRAHPQVNVAVETGKGYLSLSGKATVVKDAEIIDELWTTAAEAWFDQGRDDPTVALLEVDVETAEYWVSNEPKAITMLKYAKAAITGGHPENIADTGTVRL
ncbi:pyridoxamine 5'-phosphate oxidase family protein [Frigoribacterium sp. CFBP9039]|uniref:pyridoxamine 5'-phosphate oxidase family protein n=1 Tax=Frigoribacterium TaxID=96492 RepID=UPI00177BC6E9|nr:MULTISPECIES: pyridoxamine 5'-phosphate oxidase family protein [Frigoribacterium]MBD8704292.1 pyridoxamine 5'-phosphate oxidase family protein [Frigoribacterium sp. CFBP 13712]MCJ0701081.1 pyridoxamine 5'-phosphate oxidase family protein [Frigoribacterium faeni]MDY0891542.1 pyridoxamine 5'-phosphate oxidase family protein [Frigoribacterium sp. CFBP9030]MDY0945857.1 pyridoxamine 5'-phosphate oxidase family protein [Frigoribacterium sp. CFBP9039]